MWCNFQVCTDGQREVDSGRRDGTGHSGSVLKVSRRVRDHMIRVKRLT